MWLKSLFICIVFWVGSCTTAQDSSDIVNVVGEVFYEESKDNPNFTICNKQQQIIQYYAFNEKTYTGEKAAIIKHFMENYVNTNQNESGLVRIRFVINCNGESGRFRLLSMDSDYNSKQFSKGITNQLLVLTKALDGWKSMGANGIKRDYYQYLIFKIEKGALQEIMP